jgi:alkaline phosphatase D
MVGDQIYADMFNRLVPIGLADTYGEFQERYLTAFGSPYMRRLLRSAPTYMILDDHEIEDNWAKDRLKERKKRVLFNLAINAYMSYQWSHGPRTFGRRLYYTFDCAGYPFFVLDVRTQRTKEDIEDELDDNHLLGRRSLDNGRTSQLDRLLAWLEQAQKTHGNAPKFIVSPSVFVPNGVSTLKSKVQKNGSDSWPAFPETRRDVLDCIVKNGIQNVVFLSGDIHCSNIAEMSFSGTAKAKGIKAFSITSSAFYWPFPFADGDPSDYVHDSRAAEQKDSFTINGKVKMDYRAWNFTQEDNFCRIEIDRKKHQITVTAYNRHGEIIEETKKDETREQVVGTLDLSKW